MRSFSGQKYGERAKNHTETGHYWIFSSWGVVVGSVPADHHFPKGEAGLGEAGVVFRCARLYGVFYLPIFYFVPAKAGGGADRDFGEVAWGRGLVGGRPGGGAVSAEFDSEIAGGLELPGDIYLVGGGDSD